MLNVQKRGLRKALSILLAMVMLLTAPLGATSAYALENEPPTVTDSGSVMEEESDAEQPAFPSSEEATPSDAPWHQFCAGQRYTATGTAHHESGGLGSRRCVRHGGL